VLEEEELVEDGWWNEFSVYCESIIFFFFRFIQPSADLQK